MDSTPPASLRIAAPGRRICFWGAPAHVAPGGSLAQRLEATGANTGNLFIGHGLFHGLDCAQKTYHPGFGQVPPERLHEHYDQVFIPASNFVANSVDLASQYEYFARSRVPLFCFGLGSQLLPGEQVALKPGTLAFLRLLSERSGSIGVRGSFTASVLWDLGIRNLSVVGCPSFLALGPEARARLARGQPSLDKVGLNFSNNVRRHSTAAAGMRAGENALFQRMLTENAFYILQNEAPEMALLDAMAKPDPAAAAAAVQRIAELFEISGSRDDVRAFLERRIRVFFSAEDWIGCMATMTASVGTRFHGNVAALLAGTPALFLEHDMRTRELCEVLRVPSLALDRAVPAEEILERLLAADYAPFLRQFPRLQMEWRLFLARNGLEAVAAEAPPEPANVNAAAEPALSA
jgi:hypothetical protein